jgi:hypothetical protein
MGQDVLNAPSCRAALDFPQGCFQQGQRGDGTDGGVVVSFIWVLDLLPNISVRFDLVVL